MNSIGPTTRRITLLTDFGTCDGFTGAVRGVIAGIAPDAVVEDITHDVPRGDVHAGAWTLATYAMLYPPGTIHVAVVDPGVGSGRRAIAARVDSQIFIAPDNGLLTRVLNAASEVVEIREHAYGRSPLSSTFHGRDVFAPAAAHMARGIALDQLGPRALGIVRLRVPQPHRSEQQLHGEVVHIDRFGNLITNIPGDWLPAGDRSALDIRIGNTQIRAGRCYADVGTGELLAYEGSARMLEIAVRDGSAAAHTGLGRGAAITVQVS